MLISGIIGGSKRSALADLEVDPEESDTGFSAVASKATIAIR